MPHQQSTIIRHHLTQAGVAVMARLEWGNKRRSPHLDLHEHYHRMLLFSGEEHTRHVSELQACAHFPCPAINHTTAQGASPPSSRADLGSRHRRCWSLLFLVTILLRSLLASRLPLRSIHSTPSLVALAAFIVICLMAAIYAWGAHHVGEQTRRTQVVRNVKNTSLSFHTNELEP